MFFQENYEYCVIKDFSRMSSKFKKETNLITIDQQKGYQ